MRFKLTGLLLVSAFSIISGISFSQTEPERDSNAILKIEAKTSVIEQAQFPGGKDALTHLLSVNVKYPKEAKKKKIEGRCYLTFTVTGFGNISK